jgi:uncharacterized protein (TIGR03790 family)
VLSSFGAAESGESVLVIYNSKMGDSKQVADYYAQRRQVPPAQVMGFDLPTVESMTRREFLDQLVKPLLARLQSEKLFTFGPGTNLMGGQPVTGKYRDVTAARVRYAVLCYGVPIRVVRDADLKEDGFDTLREELRRNEAAVDNDLACLPIMDLGLKWTAPFKNGFYSTTNAQLMHPTNGLLLVTRLDGPSPDIARGLVDKAMEAETNGLWGRAYIDSRGITNGEYALGDEWMRQASFATQRLGFDTDLDENPGTLSVSYPMSHVAFYAGWYDTHASGPFTRANVEFMPGAFAYHLHSFSAETVRSTNVNWVGPFLAKGATLTMGCVSEPLLGATPDVATFLWRFIFHGFSFGEAAYACQNTLSWQTLAVGDPLYRPFGRKPAALQADLEQRRSPLLEWCHLRLVNLNFVTGTKPESLIAYIEAVPIWRKSAPLQEKLAQLYWLTKKFSDSIEITELALKQNPSPPQKVRLLLTLGERREIYGPDREAYATFQRLLKEVPDYADPLPIYKKLVTLARRLEKNEDAARWEREVQRLSPKPTP